MNDASVGKRNLIAGHLFEHKIADALNEYQLFPPLGISSELRKDLDKRKIDICTIDKKDFFEYNIQSKTSTRKLPYPKLLDDLKEFSKGRVPVVLHNYTIRNEKGRFMPRQQYAILFMDDFFNIIAELKRYKLGFKILMDHWDAIDSRCQYDVDKQLKNIDL